MEKLNESEKASPVKNTENSDEVSSYYTNHYITKFVLVVSVCTIGISLFDIFFGKSGIAIGVNLFTLTVGLFGLHTFFYLKKTSLLNIINDRLEHIKSFGKMNTVYYKEIESINQISKGKIVVKYSKSGNDTIAKIVLGNLKNDDRNDIIKQLKLKTGIDF